MYCYAFLCCLHSLLRLPLPKPSGGFSGLISERLTNQEVPGLGTTLHGVAWSTRHIILAVSSQVEHVHPRQVQLHVGGPAVACQRKWVSRGDPAAVSCCKGSGLWCPLAGHPTLSLGLAIGAWWEELQRSLMMRVLCFGGHCSRGSGGRELPLCHAACQDGLWIKTSVRG